MNRSAGPGPRELYLRESSSKIRKGGKMMREGPRKVQNATGEKDMTKIIRQKRR